MLIPLLETGGLLICDNVLFRGMVTGDRRIKSRKRTLVKKLDMFLRALSADSSLMTSIVPIGDRDQHKSEAVRRKLLAKDIRA